jgi:hypothetical protein
MKNRFKIEIIGKKKIKEEEWAALLFRCVHLVESELCLLDKFHVHLEEVKD